MDDRLPIVCVFFHGSFGISAEIISNHHYVSQCTECAPGIFQDTSNASRFYLNRNHRMYPYILLSNLFWNKEDRRKTTYRDRLRRAWEIESKLLLTELTPYLK